MGLTLTGGQGTYAIQGSSDLEQWTTLKTFALSTPSQQYTDTGAGGFRWRFYRAVLLR